MAQIPQSENAQTTHGPASKQAVPYAVTQILKKKKQKNFSFTKIFDCSSPI